MTKNWGSSCSESKSKSVLQNRLGQAVLLHPHILCQDTAYTHGKKWQALGNWSRLPSHQTLGDQQGLQLETVFYPKKHLDLSIF